MFCSNRSRDLTLKSLAQYLNHTQDDGLVLDPNYDIFKVYAYPDDDFSECMGTKIPMIRHAPIVALVLLLRFMIVLFCGFPT